MHFSKPAGPLRARSPLSKGNVLRTACTVVQGRSNEVMERRKEGAFDATEDDGYVAAEAPLVDGGEEWSSPQNMLHHHACPTYLLHTVRRHYVAKIPSLPQTFLEFWQERATTHSRYLCRGILDF